MRAFLKQNGVVNALFWLLNHKQTFLKLLCFTYYEGYNILLAITALFYSLSGTAALSSVNTPVQPKWVDSSRDRRPRDVLSLVQLLPPKELCSTESLKTPPNTKFRRNLLTQQYINMTWQFKTISSSVRLSNNFPKSALNINYVNHFFP